MAGASGAALAGGVDGVWLTDTGGTGADQSRVRAIGVGSFFRALKGYGIR